MGGAVRFKVRSTFEVLVLKRLVRVVSHVDGRFVGVSDLINLCDEIGNSHALQVKAKILCACDLRAVEAKYHRKCMQDFKQGRTTQLSSSSTRIYNLNEAKDEAFSLLCNWLNMPEQNMYFHLLHEAAILN